MFEKAKALFEQFTTSYFFKSGGVKSQADSSLALAPPESGGISLDSLRSRKDNKESYVQKMNFMSKFSTLLETRRQVIDQLEAFRKSDVVQTIVDVMVDDGFYSMKPSDLFAVVYDPGPTNGKKGSLKESDNVNEQEGETPAPPPPEKKSIPPGMKSPSDIAALSKNDLPSVAAVQKEIDSFIKEHNIKDVAGDILEDLILLGEWYLSIEWAADQGIIRIKDDIEPRNTLGVYDSQGVKFFLQFHDDDYRVREKDEIIHFILTHRKIRVRVEEDLIKKYKIYHQKNKLGEGEKEDYFPEHIRVGRSVIYPAMDKLKQLEALELGQLASVLKRVLAPLIVTVAVPGDTTPARTAELRKQYEIYIEDFFSGITSEDFTQITLGEMLLAATRVKVLPTFLDGKGALEPIDFGQGGDLEDSSAIRDDLRNSIAAATGVPAYYLAVSGEGGLAKIETLKIYSRYARKLVMLQESVGTGLRKLVMLQLRAKKIYVEEENIRVVFKPISNVDLLDDVEFLVAITTALEALTNTLNLMVTAGSVKAKINSERFVKFVNDILKIFPGAETLLEFDPKYKPPTAEL